MKIINTNSVLNFISEGNETESEQAFIERMRSYKMKANGATIQIYDDQGEQLITCINPFDNTQFICAESGYALASDFGAKRFLANEARGLMSEEKSEHPEVIKFSRDLSFPIENREDEAAICYRQFDLAGALNQFRSDKDKFYVLLSDLFNRCADFTPGKQDEYLSGGKKEDKYCRFNLMNNEEKQNVSTNQVFLMDDEDNIAGTISATVIHGNGGTLDIYFYDEIVDYFTLLNSDEISQLYEMSQHLNNEKDAAVVSELEKEIAALIEPKRMSLMAQLFAAARKSIRNSVSDLDEKIANGLVHAFIRAASGRVDAYVDLGCARTNTENFVIHGAPTAQLKMLDAHIKTWAAEQLKDLQPKLSPRLSLISLESSEAVSADFSSTPELKGFRK